MLQAGLAGSYVLERELGRGGMATVYLAHDRKHDRRVAVKVLLPELAAAIGTERFLREIQLTARLSHPHILPVHDSGELNGLPYYVMPYVEGESLRDRLNRERQLPVEEAVRLAGEVAEALDYAHAAGVLHRDVKPENVLISGRHAVVADFGIGKAMSLAGERLTQTGLAVGTPTYMSPEQAAGEVQLDGRSDLYSLGVMLFEMLAGTPPFTGPSAHLVIARRLTEPAPRLRSLRETVPEEVEQAVLKAMARSPADRFRSAGEFAAALEPYRGGTPPGVRARVTAPTPAARLATPAPSIAVLPFANMSPDPDSEYFGDGIADELISALTQLRALKVAGRTSCFYFKGKQVDLRAVGEQLNVATVLEGSVRKVGNRLRVTAQLTNVADGYQLWSQRYDRQWKDVFDIQDEITAAIVQALKVRLFAEERPPAGRRQTENLQAYELYLKGRFFWEQRGQWLLKGLECFERAVECDPSYALAYAGLADAYSLLAHYGVAPGVKVGPKAEAAARTALRLDDSLAEAHSALGVALACRGDWQGALAEFECAIAIDPTYVPAHYWLSTWHTVFHRYEEAVRACRRALEIDPLSVVARALLAFHLRAMRRVQESEEELRRALELDPSFLYAGLQLCETLLSARREEEAITLARVILDSSGHTPWAVATLGRALALAGQREEATRLLAELEARSAQQYVCPYFFAMIEHGLGNRDAVLTLLQRSADDRNPLLSFDSADPIWDGLRADPRFAAVLRSFGIERQE